MPDGAGISGPDTGVSSVLLGQVLSEVRALDRNVNEVKIQNATVVEQTKDLPQVRERLRLVELDQAKVSGARDNGARIVAYIAVAAAIAAIVAPFFHH